MTEGGDEAPAAARIATLDIVRGVAVMGILAMNIVAFALPENAYTNPLAAGHEGPADIAAWAIGFVFIDGKMRGLFSFLFGASMLLVVGRAEAAGRSGAGVHYRRMAWLLVFGLLHLYLVWWGDILSLYAPVGMVAYAFCAMRPRLLIAIAAGLLLFQFALFASFAASMFDAARAAAAPHADAAALRHWADMRHGFGVYSPAELRDALAAGRASWGESVRRNFDENALAPVRSFIFIGAETLAYMLLGMAALTTGFLSGRWSIRAYGIVVAIGFGIGVPAYAALAWWCLRDDFAVPTLVAASIAGSVPFRPAMIVATAALIILLTRSGGPLTRRIAAAGRAAFSNYLGTSLVMTAIFSGYGLGLFGHVRRVDLWWFVLGGWVLMLLWSKPWLDRFAYGPFEWLWRSLARWSWQPMRRAPA
jgi:uncharacterized protein